MFTRPRCFSLGLAVAVVALLLDQLSKWFLLEKTAIPAQPLELGPFFNLVLVWNHGISFGMLAGRNQPWPLLLLSGAIVLALLVWLVRVQVWWLAGAIGSVIGGAIGNMADRLRFGAVVDFLDVHVGNYHWPAFNVADSAIFIGVVLLCAHSMVGGDKRADEGAAP